MNDGDGKLDDLDLEKIALEAIEESFEEEAEEIQKIDASLTLPNLPPTIDSSSPTLAPSASPGVKKKLPSNWASMDAVARLRGATDQIVKEHLEQNKGPVSPGVRELDEPGKPLFALQKKEPLTGGGLRRSPAVITEKREVTRIAKVALSCTAEATVNQAEEGAAVGRRFTRHGGTEKTVVFKASQTAGFTNQQRARAIKIEGGDASLEPTAARVSEDVQNVLESDIEEFRDVTEKAIPFNVVPLTDFTEGNSSGHEAPAALKRSVPVLLGSVVIEAPQSAEVFVNGKAQGQGRIVLRNLDRFTPFWVRVHLKDHDPWSSQISLQGQKAAKVQPDLY